MQEQAQQQLPILPKKSTGKRKMSTKSNNRLTPQSISMTNLHPNRIAIDIDQNGNSDPLPRRQHLSTPFLNPPPLPPPRPTIAHSKSLTTVDSTSQKICTAV